MGKLLSISPTTICKWAKTNLVIKALKPPPPSFLPVFNKRTSRLPVNKTRLGSFGSYICLKYSCSPGDQDNYRWNEERRGQSLTSLLPLSPTAEGQAAVGERGLTVNKSVCLKVNRSEEVPRPPDPQGQLDNSIYSLCPWQRHSWQIEGENKRAGCS